MAGIVEGLFGMSPAMADQQVVNNLDARALQYAQLDPLDRAAMGMYKAGGMLAGGIAPAFGMDAPQVRESRMREQAMAGLDPSNPQSILERAAQIQDPRLKMQLTMLGRQMMAEQQKQMMETQKMALQERKQDFSEQEGMELKRQQLAQALDVAKMRSEDTRLGIDQRRQAASEANHIKLMLGQMIQDARMARIGGGLEGNIEKPMTEAQQLKLRTTMKGHRDAIGQVSQETDFLKKEVERLAKHPGLSGMTGVMGYLPSAPETPLTSGNAKAAENILEGIRGRTMSLGRAIQSQSGKLGNMAVQEWKYVSDALAALDPKSKDFPNQLKNLTAQIDGLEIRMKESYETTYEPYFERPGFESYRLENIPSGGKGKGDSGKWEASTPEEVRSLMKAGTITREQAKTILKDMGF